MCAYSKRQYGYWYNGFVLNNIVWVSIITSDVMYSIIMQKQILNDKEMNIS